MSDPIRAALIAEQLLQPVPGGIGEYVRALLDHLPAHGVAAAPVVAWHRSSDLYKAGLTQARRIHIGRKALYRRWERGRGPKAKGNEDLVHATSLAFPPHDHRPLVVTVHDVLFREFPGAYPKRGLAFHERSLARIGEVDVVIAPSQATADDLKAIEEPPERIRVVPQGTSMRAPAPAERDKVLNDLRVERPYVMWLGTVEPRKNPEGVVHGFVHAIRSGVPKGKDLNLYLVGPPGWWQGDVAEFVKKHNMTERIRRLGYVPSASRAALYAGAQAFLFPSLAEGFGLPVLEAMACGCPVVTSDRSSLPEVAGSAALLCNPDDEASIGGALARVLRDKQLAEDLRRLGLERAAQFTWERTARETAAVYREALGR